MQVAKAIIFDAKQNALILRRSGTHPTYAYHLDLPGGEVEPDESPRSAVVREVSEEAGLRFGPKEFICIHQRKQLDGQQYLLYIATIDGVKPDVTISWEHDQFMWVSLDELIHKDLPENVDDYYVMVVEYVQKHIVDRGTQYAKDVTSTGNAYS